MKKLSLAIFTYLLTLSCGGQQINNIEFDEKAGDNILIGLSNIDGLKSEPFNEWFDYEYSDYNIDDSTLLLIDKDDFIDNIKITVVMGTWCSDSRREVPRFYKILDFLEYDIDNITMICVNTDKQAENTNLDNLDIQKVPTFIIYKEGMELGRIIETPQESIEKDLAKIINL